MNPAGRHLLYAGYIKKGEALIVGRDNSHQLR